MDLAKLHNILLHTYSQDNALRKQAEEAISSLPSVPDSLILLLQLLSGSTESTVQREIRQAAAIATKNLIQKQWRIMDESNTDPNAVATDVNSGMRGLSENGKQVLRPAILKCLFDEHDSSVRSLLAEAINFIARHDFPNRWPSVIDEICAGLRTGNPLQMSNVRELQNGA